MIYPLLEKNRKKKFYSLLYFRNHGFVYWFKSDLEFQSFANYVGIQLKDEDKSNPVKIAFEIKYRLNKVKNSKILFILDGFENDKTENIFINELSKLSNVYFLITTRSHLLKELYYESELIELEPFSKLEANEFIKTNLSNKIRDSELKQLIESSYLAISENLKPYLLNKLVAYIKLNLNDLSFNYEEDDLFNNLKKDVATWKFLQICSFFNPDYIPIKHSFVTSLHIKDENILSSIHILKKLSLIQIQFERSSKGIKLDKNLQEEIKAFSIRIDSENYAKLLGYCLEKIRNLKLSSINLADERINSNLKSFLKTITELSSLNN